MARTLAHASTFAAALLLSLPGCQTLNQLAKPTASITNVRPRDLSLTSAMLDFDVEVANPYSVPLPLADLDYRLATGGKPFLTGQAPISGAVPAGGKKVVTVPVRVSFADLLAAVTSITPGSVVPYDAGLGLSVNAPALGPLRLDLGKKGEVPVPAVPEVSLDHVAWDQVTLDKAGGTLHVKIKNTNQFPIDLSRLQYDLALAGTRVGGTTVEKMAKFEPGAENVIELPVSISPKNLGVGLLNMLLGKGSGYSLGGNLDLDTPFGPIRVPYQKGGQTTFTK